MTGADLFIGGVNTVNNTWYGKDYHGTGKRMPIEDLNGQDWDVMVGSEREGMTSLLIGRLLDTKSPEEDFTISDSDVYVLWSYGENDTINHHVARGSRRLNLFIADDAVTTTTRKPGSGSGSPAFYFSWWPSSPSGNKKLT
ncbi:unnamed protein product [Orchesella dallaii]|uniref:DOMON domain-containing protein n=1 Tax=Orchesella dallaii TaxID=48710 RepID=A0ABP1RPJ5_9HEXA